MKSAVVPSFVSATMLLACAVGTPSLADSDSSPTAPMPGAAGTTDAATPLTGLKPNQPLTLPAGRRTTGLEPNGQPATTITPEDLTARSHLESIADQATTSSGAIFKDADHVVVKAPMLTALITLDKKRSPYDLDANSQASVTLRDVLNTAMASNLNIKIVHQDSEIKRWNLYQGISGFLPNIVNDINYEGISGQYVSPAGVAIPIHNPFLTMSTGFQWNLFTGGTTYHTFKQDKHEYKASKYALSGSINDVLEEVTRLYYDLVLNEVLLQIRIKAVQTTNALLLVNKDLFANGVNTELDVLQAQYQLSEARQQLIAQQVARREAAVKLATAINLDPEVDLTSADPLVSKIELVGSDLSPADLMKLAIDNRPELKRYEQLRLAAIDQMKAARGTLLPQIQGQGTILGSGSRAYSSALAEVSGLSTSGLGVGPLSDLSNLPLGGEPTGGRTFTTRSLFIIGIDAQWNLGGLGLKQVSQINMARADARKASLEFNRSLADIYKQVRDSYLSSIAAQNLIVETTDTVNYGAEELRVAEIRLKDGVGTNLDVINAQRDYINSLIAKANALVKYDVAQASILHAVGRVSVDTLTSNVPLKQ